MIPPPSPPSFSLYVLAALLLLRRRHIKPHLTSISVKETGASGCRRATTQLSLPPNSSSPTPLLFLPYLLSQRPQQRPFSAASRRHFHVSRPDKTSNFGERSCRGFARTSARGPSRTTAAAQCRKNCLHPDENVTLARLDLGK